MSLHKSFKTGDSLKKHRNVLTRRERLDKLAAQNKWSAEDDSVYNLPKVVNRPEIKRKKKKEAPKDDE